MVFEDCFIYNPIYSLFFIHSFWGWKYRSVCFRNRTETLPWVLHHYNQFNDSLFISIPLKRRPVCVCMCVFCILTCNQLKKGSTSSAWPSSLSSTRTPSRPSGLLFAPLIVSPHSPPSNEPPSVSEEQTGFRYFKLHHPHPTLVLCSAALFTV